MTRIRPTLLRRARAAVRGADPAAVGAHASAVHAAPCSGAVWRVPHGAVTR